MLFDLTASQEVTLRCLRDDEPPPIQTEWINMYKMN